MHIKMMITLTLLALLAIALISEPVDSFKIHKSSSDFMNVLTSLPKQTTTFTTNHYTFKNQISVALIATCLSIPMPSFAVDLNENGAKLFESSCSFCHKGGGNLLPFMQDKTLAKDALEKNGYSTKESVLKLVTEGKGAMPAYGPFISPIGNPMPARLSELQISDVTDYVLYKAETGWK